MPINTDAPTQSLGSIVECHDLSVDACIVEAQTHELIFMSVWGRDTAIQELLARLTLEASAAESLKGGIVLKRGEQYRDIYFRDTASLEKRTSREYRGTLFGSLLHLWLFNPHCIRADRSQHSAYVLLQAAHDAKTYADYSDGLGKLPDATRKRLASALRNLAPFPILPAWADVVLDEARRQQMLIPQQTLLGDLTCYPLHLDSERLEQSISGLIRSGQLPLS